jgi:hypothetical protein
MIRVFQIVVLSCVCLLLTGCKNPPSTAQQRSHETGKKNKPIWEQVKIGDLAPPAGSGQLDSQFLKTINFDVHIFEIPPENISKLDDIWKALNIQPLRFRDYKAFRANLFDARFGQTATWNTILDLLQEAEGQKTVTVKLLIQDGQSGDVVVARLNSKQDILYISSGGLTDKATVGPGVLSLRIRAGKVAGSRDMCNIIAEPVFTVPTSSSIPSLSKFAQRHEFTFAPVAFGLKMSPGDLVLLGPQRYISDWGTLCGLFFSEPKDNTFFSETKPKQFEIKQTVKIFILVCTNIID